MIGKKLLYGAVGVLLSLPCAAQDVGAAIDVLPQLAAPIRYPALSTDGKTLVFLADEDAGSKCYMAHYSGTAWSAPEPFEYFNTLMAENSCEAGGFFFNYDNTQLYFHARIGQAQYGIYSTRKRYNKWEKPEKLNLPFEGKGLYSPSLSADGKTLFVLVQEPGSAPDNACKKLHLVERDKSGAWQPKYLPLQINEGCVETPFFCADNATLFFASMRSDTYNGQRLPDDVYNLYYTRRIDESDWFLPVYLPSLSTEHNDLSPTLSTAGQSVYTNVKAKRKKRQPQKIYANPLPDDKRPSKIFTLSGTITDANSKKPLEANIFLQDAVTSFDKGNFRSNEEGKFSILLPQGSLYRVDISNPDYSHVFINKDLTYIGEQTTDSATAEIFSAVTLELNVYDNELFYPLNPRISITDSATGKKVDAARISRIMTGKYRCQLDLGAIYTITLEADRFVSISDVFDLRGAVVYREFEKSMEMQAARREIKMNVSSGEGAEAVAVEERNLTRDETGVTLVMYDTVGNPVLSLREGDAYDVNVWKKGYTYFNTTVDLSSKSIEKIEAAVKAIQEKPIVLQELTKATKMVFNNITFETNAAELNAGSYEEVLRLAKFLTENPDIRIEISAHTDDVGSNIYNLRLSGKRATSVVDFLAHQGIARERMESRGYGEEHPLLPNTSDENRAANRRVEIKIID
jgi:outer membrane protein OmpA-like peptidoglycan-associated protein